MSPFKRRRRNTGKGPSIRQVKKVGKALLVPLIISHDGAIHKDTVKQWNDTASDIKVDWDGKA